MPRIDPLDPRQATGSVRLLFTSIQARLGSIPLLHRVMGRAPAVLSGFLGLEGLLADGSLGERIRAQLALVIAEVGQSEYCLAAKVDSAVRCGLTPQEIADARCARSADPRTAAMLCFARTCVIRRGEVDNATVDEARAAGIRDAELLELVGQVCLQVFGNYVAHLSAIRPDFPFVALGEPPGPT